MAVNTKLKRRVNELLQNKKSPLIIEIGAHYGEDTEDIIDVFDSPEVICFEPHPGNASFIRKHFKIEGEFGYYKGAKICLYEVALSETNGESVFNVLDTPLPDEQKVPEKYSWIDEEDYRQYNLNNTGSCSLKKGYSDHKTYEITVQTKRLDDVLDVSHVDFIWIDVQGAEREVVNGGRNIFSKTAYVWTECGEKCYDGAMSRQETISLFENLGFVHIGGDRHNLFLENKNVIGK